MRTSESQFEVMVAFMEQFGDLGKPRKEPGCRIENMRQWEKLTGLLNAEGGKKNEAQWRKVWADLKSNTKKKTHRVRRAAVGADGSCKVHLTPLEERVVGIMGPEDTNSMMNITEGGAAPRRRRANHNATGQETDLNSIPMVMVTQPLHPQYSTYNEQTGTWNTMPSSSIQQPSSCSYQPSGNQAMAMSTPNARLVKIQQPPSPPDPNSGNNSNKAPKLYRLMRPPLALPQSRNRVLKKHMERLQEEDRVWRDFLKRKMDLEEQRAQRDEERAQRQAEMAQRQSEYAQRQEERAQRQEERAMRQEQRAEDRAERWVQIANRIADSVNNFLYHK